MKERELEREGERGRERGREGVTIKYVSSVFGCEDGRAPTTTI